MKKITVDVALTAKQAEQLNKIVALCNEWHRREYGKGVPVTNPARVMHTILHSVAVERAISAECASTLEYQRMMLAQQRMRMR